MKRVESKDEMVEHREYLVLMPRYVLGECGVTEAIVDCTEWHFADWSEGEFMVDFGGDHYERVGFDGVKAVFGLPGTHTEFDGGC